MVLGVVSCGRYVKGRARLRRGEGRRSLRASLSHFVLGQNSDATGEAVSGFAAIQGLGAHQEL